ncbi:MULTISPECIES: sulfur carrier protein ThiS [Tatumella]|uniref:Sulfur carrier protein ThiS n=1 Tax=Tatumella punctata TaxID=399969 RepID=A0ABW1VU17_9GAMM|nr:MULTISPECIES: sulfur carrier protein ThiS [unclassified Tatumella]MBS0857452.1 sulfur carrier protein ThiS [Tatumella sp. JGM16]MBS0878801.1 sulfur carrier protein ThiS [Tatumella sp. JGM82]MBS0892260.1 sulfur carrier protein ThiS [Tatumella sp. JGM94]MBS0895249.1 sulfur carrier protein ThiS [Tatumella sp. JGM130]MBS0901131.1 sulfur carrier protein ThiS [Tatumella sp. JGM100]
MQIKLNDIPTEISHACLLSQLLQQISVGPQGTALAVNGRVIPATRWAEYQVQENDDVVVFQVIAGG